MEKINEFLGEMECFSFGYHPRLAPKVWAGEVLGKPEIPQSIGQRKEEEMTRNHMTVGLRN